ncbi:MAG: c-type cytochrome [Gammaproteobacteria bacterium]|uniref:C-type cytochrome n=1 Tax=Candidatus Thiopontia autotrophica TaxID=2841688 RepID=A0A8J6TS33_9GAMM|nr:c-type cytochrome [Candidatus Thiopontia autotrophica]
MKKAVLTQTLVAAAVLAISGTVMAGGDVDAGKAKAAVCGACHGATGHGNPAFPDPMNPGKTKAVPALAGQNAGYLAKQMEDFKSGARKDLLMTGQALGLSDADIANLAAYYATAAGADGGSVDAGLAAKGKSLYQGGDMARGVTACMACHGPDAAGNDSAGWPGLTGQLADYTTAQLNAFGSGARYNDPNRMMQDVASRLTDGDISAVTAYIQSMDGVVASAPVAATTAPEAPAPEAPVVAETVAAPAAAAKEAAPAPAAAPASAATGGAALFQAGCFACHGPMAPALNAPQIGVKDNWAPRLEKAGGRDGLVASAIAGVAGTAMAPKGGTALSDAEIGAVIDHIIAQAGL